MDTTHATALIDILIGYSLLAHSCVLQVPQSRDELNEMADEVYAELLSAGMTPAQIAAAVPGVEVFA